MSGYEKALRYSPPLDPYLTGLVKLENVRTVHTRCLYAVHSFPPSLCPLNCSMVQYTALHCTALHCTALHCTALHYSVFHYATLYFSFLIFQFLILSYLIFSLPYSTSSHTVLSFHYSSGEEVAQSVRG